MQKSKSELWDFNPFPSVVIEILAYTQKINQELLRGKGKLLWKKANKTSRTCAMLDNHREQVCEVSIHSLQ
jgi:hypothetical protein